jgi:hypothetical protein
MNLNIGTIGAFLVILFSINVCMVGLGLVDGTWTTKNTVLNSSPSELQDNYYNNDLNVSTGDDVEGGTDSTTDPDLISGVPYKTGIFGRSTEFVRLLGGLTIGYSAIFFAMDLPILIIWLLTGIIAFLEFLAIFYLLTDIFSILRGGGGI